MTKKDNYLKVYRKKTPLQLSEVAYLVGYTAESTLSRYELGHREPTIELLLIYEILFDVRLNQLFEPKHLELIPSLHKRLNELLNKLNDNNTGKNIHKIQFLEQVIIRIKEKYYE